MRWKRSTCVLDTGGHNLEGLAVYLGLPGEDFEILDSPELVERLHALAARYHRAAAAGS